MPRLGKPERVISELAMRGQTLAVAESLTGGALAARLVDVPGASMVLRGAVVAYQNSVKSHLLGVDAGGLEEFGAVTREVALQMARGVKSVLEDGLPADYGVATTGVAGPDPDPVTGQPPGVVFIAVSGPDGQEWVEKLEEVGSRKEIRAASAAYALGLLEAALGLAPEGA